MPVLDTEIVAALIWDLPTLRRGSASAASFAESMVGRIDKWWEPETFADDTLGLAARAVAHERADEVDEAAACYEELSADAEAGSRLLGLMLQAWSQSGKRHSILAAREALEAFDLDDDLRARLIVKIATYAFDAEEQELGRAALDDAIEVAPQGGRLRWLMTFEALNYGIGRDDARFGDQPPPSEAITDYPWIHDYLLAAADRSLKAEIDRRARRAWTWQFTIGGQPAYSDALSAEVQCTWAGALWVRPAARLHLAGQLLTGAAETPKQWAYGLLMWILASGPNPHGVYRLIEPKLDAKGVEFVVTEAWKGPRVNDRLHALSVANEAWDAISESTLRALVSELEPRPGDDPTARDTRDLWSAYAARLPEAWFADLTEQSPEVQAALVGSLGAGVISHLPSAARKRVFEISSGRLSESDAVDSQTMLIAATSAPTEKRAEVGALIAQKAKPSEIARMPESVISLLDEETLARSRLTLAKAVEEQEAESRTGTVSFGSFDQRLALGKLAAQADDPTASSLLVSVATAEDLPSEHIAAARNILVFLRRNDRLSREQLDALHQANDDVGSFPEHGGIFKDTLRARRLEILAPELTEGEVAMVVADCRAPEARVRMISLATCAQAIENGGQGSDYDALLWSLVGGVSDPDDEVVAAAINHLPEAQVEANPSAARLTIERLAPLMSEASSEVRGSTAELARRWLKHGSRHRERLLRLLEIAAFDKSWLVRESARADDEREHRD